MTATMAIYTTNNEWDASRYSKLLSMARQFAGFFTLTKRTEGHGELACFATLRVFLISRTRSSRWPGTMLMDGSEADVYKFRVSDESIAAFKGCAPQLWSWIRPDMPEDLSFLRNDSTPIFVSITHEKDAFFKLREPEIKGVEGLLGCTLRFERFDECSEEKY